ncbi:hypothetical protein KAU86_01325 [bacterium]|nr:hypothetical protein [bacterium]MCK4326757.1 hypothetical protein [bacterium]MCK4436567.1 hypothetical protein [bacterium]
MKADLSLALYLLLFLAFFLLLWAQRERKKRYRSIHQEEGYLWQCSICTFIYLDPEEDKLSHCPRCHSFNRRGQ